MSYWKTKLNGFLTQYRVHLKQWAPVSVVLLLISCTQDFKRTSYYYPIDSLITDQINYLAVSNASIRKVVMLAGQEGKTSFVPADTSAWIKELDIFRDLKTINKPVNQGFYTIEDNIADNKSNLKIKAFTCRTDLPVAFLKIYYHGTLNKVRRIEARFNEANSMYQASRDLTLEFQEINNKTILTYYAIDGGQKMFLGDSIQYTVNASVSLPNN